jgi:CO dehydrogenase maturation factor
LRKHLPDFEFLGFLPYDDTLIEADLSGASPYDTATTAKQVVAGIIDKLYADE